MKKIKKHLLSTLLLSLIFLLFACKLENAVDDDVIIIDDELISLTELTSREDGEVVVVKAYSTYYLGSTLYIYDSSTATTAVSTTATIMENNDAILGEGKEVIIKGVKTTVGDRAGIKSVSEIVSTKQIDYGSNQQLTTLLRNQLSNNIYKYIDLSTLTVYSKPSVFDDSKNVAFEVTDGTSIMKILVPKDEDNTFSQKVFITLSELAVGHEMVLKNILLTYLDNEEVLYITRKSEVSYVHVMHVYQKPIGEVDDEYFNAFLDEMFLYYLGDSPFNTNYLIYDIEGFDLKYGTNLANAQVIATTEYDMTPAAEIEYYHELVDKKNQLLLFNRNNLSSNQKLSYDVVLDYINHDLNYFEFTDEGKIFIFTMEPN